MNNSFIDSNGIEFVWCPPGRFLMGSPPSEDQQLADETQHAVELIRGFWIGKYPITQGQWQQLSGSNPSHFRPDVPVESVSWAMAMALCAHLNQNSPLEGWSYALPTEAQWEYACQAGTMGALNVDGASFDLPGVGLRIALIPSVPPDPETDGIPTSERLTVADSAAASADPQTPETTGSKDPAEQPYNFADSIFGPLAFVALGMVVVALVYGVASLGSYIWGFDSSESFQGSGRRARKARVWSSIFGTLFSFVFWILAIGLLMLLIYGYFSSWMGCRRKAPRKHVIWIDLVWGIGSITLGWFIWMGGALFFGWS
ncbi:MAG: formylglycine-generating enzyme family protein [Prosthecobacter sp.]|nr:formylglycine-generating enzyme family protein [Prosthecobacter sp.]